MVQGLRLQAPSTKGPGVQSLVRELELTRSCPCLTQRSLLVSQLGFEMLCLGYLARFPRLSSVHCRFIAEEAAAAGAKCVLTPSPTWIVDPIDGTCNFVHR